VSSQAERLLVVAHGTASAKGTATTTRLVRAVAAARPDTDVDLCFLDVVAPRLTDALDERPTVVVPLLLSTGYHVQTDIPAATQGHRDVRVAAHLGPDPLIADALIDRLEGGPSASSVLVGVGSNHPAAAAELATMARLLGARLGCDVVPATISASLPATLAALPAPVRVATYLLAEGQFLTALRAAVAGRGSVAAPIGVHPALVELVWRRYDAARRTR
jgi:sirohydrochlorin ferrochelatase